MCTHKAHVYLPGGLVTLPWYTLVSVTKAPNACRSCSVKFWLLKTAPEQCQVVPMQALPYAADMQPFLPVPADVNVKKTGIPLGQLEPSLWCNKVDPVEKGWRASWCASKNNGPETTHHATRRQLTWALQVSNTTLTGLCCKFIVGYCRPGPGKACT